MNNQQRVLDHLGKLPSTDEQLAVLDKVLAKRKSETYIKYWQTITEDQKKAINGFKPGIKIVGVLGGNRSGKTELGAAVGTAWMLGKRYFEGEPAWEWVQNLPIPEPPNNVWVVGLDFPTLRDVIWREKLRLGKTHPPFLPTDGSIIKTNDSDFQVFASNGSVLTGKSADSGREKFQGASVNLVWIDEEPEVEIFDECYQRTVDCRGLILLTLTPLTDIASGARTPWVFDLFEEARKGKSDISFYTLSVLDNPIVPQEEKDKLLEKWSGHPEEKARLYGQFVQRSGLVYNQWDPAKHFIKPIPLPREWRRVVSIDPAATGTTAALWGAISPNGDIYLYREYYESNRIVSEHAKNILVRNTGDAIDYWLIDPKWGAQRNAETHRSNAQLYRDANIPVRLAEVGEDFGLNASREYVAATLDPNSRGPRLYVFDSLGNFRFEIEHYTWDYFQRGEMKGLSKEKPRKRDDHLLNAFQYMAAMRPKGKRGNDILGDMSPKKYAELNSYS